MIQAQSHFGSEFLPNSTEPHTAPFDQKSSRASPLEIELITTRSIQFDPSKREYCLFPSIISKQEHSNTQGQPIHLESDRIEETKDIFQIAKEGALSIFNTSNSHSSAKPCRIIEPIEVIEAASNNVDLVAVLISDQTTQTDSIVVFSLQDIHVQSIKTEPILPVVTLSHPIQTHCKTIQWSKTEPNVLAVGCLHGVLVWHAKSGFLSVKGCHPPARRIKAAFYSLAHGYSVDTISFACAHNEFMACSAAGTGITKVFSLVSVPNESTVVTLTTNRGIVGQIEWSKDDHHLSVQYHHSPSIDIFKTRSWENIHWKLGSSSVEYTCWFVENSCQKLLVATETTATIFNFTLSGNPIEHTLEMNDTHFAKASFFKFFEQSMDILCVHGPSLGLHSLLYEHSDHMYLAEVKSASTDSSTRANAMGQSIVFVDDSQHVCVMRPKIQL